MVATVSVSLTVGLSVKSGPVFFPSSQTHGQKDPDRGYHNSLHGATQNRLRQSSIENGQSLWPLTTRHCFHGVPVPLNGIWTLAAPWRTTNKPVRAPLAVGAKVTVTEHLLPGARLAPQCGFLLKSRQFVPLVAKPKGSRKLAATVPVFVTVTVCGLLGVPTGTLPKSSPPGDSVKTMLPVPLLVSLRGLEGFSGH
jgi:hypothetical protein